MYAGTMVRRNRELIKAEILKRLDRDPSFRQQLLRDPGAALKSALDYELPAGLAFEVLEETPERVYFVLPPGPPERDAEVSLREITSENVHAICALEVRPDQQRFVATNATSLAEARFSPLAWYRAIYAGETPVGFVMLADDADEQRYFVWRYMIDREYQGLGFGRKAMALVIDYVRSRPGARELTLSYSPGDGSPQGFYASLGFEDTGESLDHEKVMRLTL